MLNRLHNQPPEPIPDQEPWKALPGSQAQFLGLRADHLLYTGSRGPGKTDTQLFRFKRWVNQGYGKFWRGVIFDREYKNLDDIISKSKRWFPLYDDGAKFLESGSQLKWVWPTGEELMFRVAKEDRDYWKYHGQELPFIGWNELCKYPSDSLYEMMTSCNRSSYTPEKDGYINGLVDPKTGAPVLNAQGLQIGPVSDGKGNVTMTVPAPIPLEVVSTTNPYGPGHNWVKKRFIAPVPFGTVQRTKSMVYDPAQKQNVEVEKTQVAMVGSYRENPYLSPKYIATITSIKDKNKRKAWLGGSWDIVAGGALDDVWAPTKQVKKRFVIPAHWHMDRALDWGSSHPLAVVWVAEANGEDAVMLDGTTWCPPAGSLIVFDELYLTEELGSNIGKRLGSRKVAELIKRKEIEMLQTGWIKSTPWPGPADNQIWDVRDASTETHAKLMSDEGIDWERSDKSGGTRKVGLQLMRDMLEASQEGYDRAGLYFTNNCRVALDLLPTLPRDEDDLDDVDTDAEDHIYDAIRYRVLKGSLRSFKLKVKMPT